MVSRMLRPVVLAGGFALLSACGDSAIFGADSLSPIGVRSFETGRTEVDMITVGADTFRIVDIEFTYDGGRVETRRYAITRSGGRISCGDDCDRAIRAYQRGEVGEDHGY